MSRRNGTAGEAETPGEVFGTFLRRRREAAGLTQTRLAQLLHYDRTRYVKVETGKQVPSLELVKACDLHLNTGSLITEMWHDINWYPALTFHPDWFRFYVEKEGTALTLHEWYPFGIPGLLQTECYMREQLAGWHRPGRVDELTEARLSRQERLFEEDPLILSALIDEGVLRRWVGDRATMGAQLGHLLKLMRRPNVTVQVVPQGRSQPITVDSTVAFLGMPDGSAWFYTEGLDHGRITRDPITVAGHRARYDLRRSSALPVTESRELIRRAMGELINVTPDLDMSKARIFKSSYSGGGNGCVGTTRDFLDVGLAPIVDTKLGTSSPVLPFTTDAFAAFVAAVKAGEFPTV
jgi:transcriptional regulator with XRE-family HTH domain